MARSTFVAKCKNATLANNIIQKVLTDEGYQLMLENNEHVWKCGSGAVIAMRYIKFDFVDQTTVHITGWIKSTIGPEQCLDGYINGYPKKQVRKTIQNIQAAIL